MGCSFGGTSADTAKEEALLEDNAFRGNHSLPLRLPTPSPYKAANRGRHAGDVAGAASPQQQRARCGKRKAQRPTRAARLRGTAMLHAAMPLVLLAAVLVAASVARVRAFRLDASDGGSDGDAPPSAATLDGAAEKLADGAVRHMGVALPFAVFAVQAFVLPYGTLVKARLIGGSNALWYWGCSTLGVWSLMAVLRGVLYLFLSNVNYYFSDHICLMTCMLGQISIKLFVLDVAFRERKAGLRLRASLPLLLGWLLVLLVLVDAYATARYYHTLQASWTAYAAGVAVFGSFAYGWICVLTQGT